MELYTDNLTQAFIHTDRLTHNISVLQQLVGNRPLWPAIKANAYGHGIDIVARHLVGLGYNTLCVAHVSEAIGLIEAGIEARFLLMSATLPEHSEAIVSYGCEPVLCTQQMAQALSYFGQRSGRQVLVHIMVDTGMGRIGISPDAALEFIEYCLALPALRIRGLMSHFPCADEADKSVSLEGLGNFRRVIEAARSHDIEVCHMANSAAILDLADACFDAVRPGIAVYGLSPSAEISNPQVQALQPVLEWKTRITFLKEVPADTGLSYGHAFHTERPSLIATLPVGYGDGLSRNLSNKFEVLAGGLRCPQVGRITMDQSLIDVTALRGQVALGDEVVIIGRQGEEEVTADTLARLLGTINYEVVTAISQRVPRIVVSG
jgi:alanine racemase